MKRVEITNAACPRVQPIHFKSPDREKLTAALRRWRQRLGYLSILTAVPAIMGWPLQDVKADEPTMPREPSPVTGQNEQRQSRRIDSSAKPRFLQRNSAYQLPHQRTNSDLVSSFTGGADDCPGAAVPLGPYSVAAPFINNGDTTGANSTISNIGYYYYYSFPVSGPDLIYSFTLTARGPAAEIKVTPSVAGFDPAIYILDSRYGCPAGTGNTIYSYWAYNNTAGPGRAEIINTGSMSYLPLNVPLYLVVDSVRADDAGPYTLRMEDVTISSGTRTKFDFNGDSRSDFAVFRPSDGFWYIANDSGGFTGQQFGLASDRIVPADYDGDGKTDIAIYRDGVWWWIDSSTKTVRAVQFGLASDTPVPADFTGDGRAELAIFRDGVWWTYNLVNGEVTSTQFGLAGDKPVVGDYDGDGRADRAVYRDGIWYIDRSSQGFFAVKWGLPTDKVVPADYDGDGKLDAAVYRNGDWWVLGSISGAMYFHNGTTNDIPTPMDFNGDGLQDFAVYRDGAWHAQTIWGSETTMSFGVAGDRPAPSAYNR